jgi:hypothetical protein
MQPRDDVRVSVGTEQPRTELAKHYASFYLPYAMIATAAYSDPDVLDHPHCPDVVRLGIPSLTGAPPFDWNFGRRPWPSLLSVAQVVQPDTILRWHRTGFRAYWRWKSRNRAGRSKIDRELRDLIRRMSKENPLWGAPRIHGELLKLGFEVAQSAVCKYMVRRQKPPSQTGGHSSATTGTLSRRSISA